MSLCFVSLWWKNLASRSFILILGLCATLFTVACAEARRLGGIQGSTQRTEKTTEELNGTSKELKTSLENVENDTRLLKLQLEQTKKQLEMVNAALLETNSTLGRLIGIWGSTSQDIESLVRNTWFTYLDLRRANAQGIRAEQLKAVEQASGLSAKTLEAYRYFLSFEFQLWKGVDAEGAKSYATLLEEAALEFTNTLGKYLPSSPVGSSATYNLSPVDDSSEQQNMLALALALDAGQCVVPTVDAQFGICSVEDLLTSGLSVSNSADANEESLLVVGESAATKDLKNVQKLVLEAARQVEHLLMLRINALSALVIDGVVTLPGERTLMRRLKLLSLTAGRWEAQTVSLNMAQLEKLVGYLEKSDRLKRKLTDVGIKIRFDDLVKKAILNGVFVEIKDIEQNSTRTLAQETRLALLKKLQTLFLGVVR